MAGTAGIGQQVEDFLTAGRARGLSPKTIKDAYGYPLRSVFVPFCERQGVTEVSQIDRRLLDRLSTELLEQGGRRNGTLSKFSVKSYLKAVNQFLAWAKEEGERVEARAQMPRTPKRLLDVLSRDEIQALEDAAVSERDKLIIRLLADTGIRAGELVSLRTGDLVDRDRNHFLRIRGKGERERLLPIPRLHRRLERYIRATATLRPAGDRLFLSLRRGSDGQLKPLTVRAIEKAVEDARARAGITKRVHPHLFRHSYATWALTRGMNPIMLAQVLGHNSLTMIHAVYSHLSPNDSYDAVVRMLTEP
jgi:integrase